VENGRLAGLKVAETKTEGRKAEPIPGSEHELRAPLVVSSIGSVPEKLSGINMNGEYYTFAGKDVPRYTAMDAYSGSETWSLDRGTFACRWCIARK